MSDAPKNNKKDNDIDISAVMDKIVEETIGHITVAKPTPIKKIQKQQKAQKKAAEKARNSGKLPSKKKVILDKKVEIKGPEKAVEPQKEVHIFFPKQKNVEAVKQNQKEEIPKKVKIEQPKQDKQQSKQDKQQPKQEAKQQPKQDKQQPKQDKQQPKQEAKQQPKQDKQQPKQEAKQQPKQDKQQPKQEAKQQPKQDKQQSKQEAKQQPKQDKQQPKQEAKQQPKQDKQQPKQEAKQQPKQEAKQAKQQPKQDKQQPKQEKQQPKQEAKQQPKQAKQQPKQNKQEQNQQTKTVPIQLPKQPVQSQIVQEEVPKKKHTLRNVLLAFLGMTFLGALGVYGYFAYYYHDKFIPGTYINQISSHELNSKQVEEQIRKRVEDYSIDIDFRGDKKESIDGKDIEYAFVSDGSVEKILQEQNSLLWIAGHFKNYEYDVPESITFNDAKLKQEYDALESIKKDNQEKPEDAYVFYQHKNFEIIPEIEGTSIDDNILYPVVAEAIQASARTCSAEEAKAYIEPQARTDSPELATEVRELNTLASASIMYKLPHGDEVLDGNMLRLWLQKDASGHYTKDELAFNAHAEAYVKRMAEAVDTLGKPHKFKMTNGPEVEVEGGDYGWQIDQVVELEKLKEELKTNAKVEREPEYASREFSTENNGFGDTYIEVNLSLQHMYVYEKGQLVLESDIVTGRMNRKRWTPPGVFTLTSKTKNKVLRGPMQPDGKYEWESPVSYWMPFNGGIGFHDATWNPSFGGTRYIYSGSHGCINMPYYKAQALYDIITKEFPIICFYSEPYELYY